MPETIQDENDLQKPETDILHQPIPRPANGLASRADFCSGGAGDWIQQWPL
jgi:hypothetical protein